MGRRPAPPGIIGALPCTFVEERYESELTRAAAVLDGVDRALEHLSAGTYGQCDTCGAPVLQADLERDPTLCMCEQHLTLA
jgi:RNA polymerase-binding transcription factor DksA